MYRFHVKSIVLGVGIGIILTSIISMIYLAGVHTGMTREEIIEKAKEYGMVEQPFIDNDENTAEKQADEDASVEQKDKGPSEPSQPDVETAAVPEPQLQEQKPQEQKSEKIQPVKPKEVKFVIEPGNTTTVVAKNLQDAGIIEDSQEFIKRMQKSKLTTKLRSGTYTLTVGSDFDTIVKTIMTKQ